MNHKSISLKIEAGPNISQNPDLGANVGEATRQPTTPSRLTRAKIAAGLLVFGLVPPRERRIQPTLDEKDDERVVRTQMDVDTGAITELYGDGRRVAVVPYSPAKMPEATVPTPVTPPEVPPTAK